MGCEETAWLSDFWFGNYINLKEDENLEDFSALIVRIGGLRARLRERLEGRSRVQVSDLVWIRSRLGGPTRYC